MRDGQKEIFITVTAGECRKVELQTAEKPRYALNEKTYAVANRGNIMTNRLRKSMIYTPFFCDQAYTLIQV